MITPPTTTIPREVYLVYYFTVICTVVIIRATRIQKNITIFWVTYCTVSINFHISVAKGSESVVRVTGVAGSVAMECLGQCHAICGVNSHLVTLAVYSKLIVSFKVVCTCWQVSHDQFLFHGTASELVTPGCVDTGVTAHLVWSVLMVEQSPSTR